MVYQFSPRHKAVKILKEIFRENKPLKKILQDVEFENYSPSDRGFLIELIYGVLRNLYYIDWLLEDFYKDKKNLSQETINNLRCAVYQLIFMKLPPYAVTNETVKVEKSFKGLPSVVNAILRNFIRKYVETEQLKELPKDKLTYLSIKYSHPKWLIKKWLRRFSQEETEKILKTNNKKPPFTIAVKPEERDSIEEYLNKKGLITRKTLYAPSGLIIEGQGHEIRDFLMASDFFWIVQDEASQIACFLLEAKKDMLILDACSSPGGKALLTAALMEKGKVICLEKDAERFRILKQNIERVKKFLPHMQIEAIHSDVLNYCEKDSFDRIILDAPCSSLGVIRRNPDVRYRVNMKEIERLAENQMLLLEKVSKFLNRRGILLYVVCSSEPEEGEKLIYNFLHKFSEFCTINSKVYPFKDLKIGEGMWRTYCHREGMDSFFIARLGYK